MNHIKHIWFDLEGTLIVNSPEFQREHDVLLYATYAKAIKKPLTDALKQEFDRLYQQYGTNSAVFRSLGLPSDYWSSHFMQLDSKGLDRPNPNISDTLEKLQRIIPISLFTNSKHERIEKSLPRNGMKLDWFTYIISGDDIKERKPELDGFYLILKKSQIAPEEILYIGDRVKADIRPAKKVGMQTGLVWSKSDEADYSFEKFEDILTLF